MEARGRLHLPSGVSSEIFAKDIEGIVTTGTGVVNYTTPSGVSQDVIITGPSIPDSVMEMADQVTELRRGI